MKIGVVSDTHSRAIPNQLIEDFKNVDLIVHTGDFVTEDVLKFFQKIKEVKAVYGNMDESAIRGVLPDKDIFEAGGCRIGLYHGRGTPGEVPSIVQGEFSKSKVDVVIFGHSHIPYNEVIKDVLYFCPGSPNDHVFAPYCSYGVITIEESKATGEIIKVDE